MHDGRNAATPEAQPTRGICECAAPSESLGWVQRSADDRYSLTAELKNTHRPMMLGPADPFTSYLEAEMMGRICRRGWIVRLKARCPRRPTCSF